MKLWMLEIFTLVNLVGAFFIGGNAWPFLAMLSGFSFIAVESLRALEYIAINYRSDNVIVLNGDFNGEIKTKEFEMNGGTIKQEKEEDLELTK